MTLKVMNYVNVYIQYLPFHCSHSLNGDNVKKLKKERSHS